MKITRLKKLNIYGRNGMLNKQGANVKFPGEFHEKNTSERIVY